MNTYRINYQIGDKTEWASIEGTDVGNAFAKCQKQNPGAVMLRAVRDGEFGAAYGHTEYDPPPAQRDPQPEPRPPRLPKPRERDGIFPFYDEVIGRRYEL